MGMIDFAAKAMYETKDGLNYAVIGLPKTMVVRMKELLSVASVKHEGFLRVRFENLTRPKSYPQLKMVVGMLRKIYYAVGCDQWGVTEAKGMEQLLAGMLQLACKEFGYPYIMVGTVLIPKPLSTATSIEVDMLIQTIISFAGAHGIDISKEMPYDAGF